MATMIRVINGKRVRVNDPVNHPSHYTKGGIEVIEFIEAWDFNFFRGSAIKYIARAGLKDKTKEVEDLKKANWLIEREIRRIENG